MERWTRFVLRFRWPILTGWLVVLARRRLRVYTPELTALERVLGPGNGLGAGEDDSRAPLRRSQRRRVHGRLPAPRRRRPRRLCAPSARRRPRGSRRPGLDAAAARPGGPQHHLRRHRLDAQLAKAKGYTDDLYRALPHGGGVQSYVTGQAAIQHDLDPIFSKDLRKGEMIALPIAVLVLLAVFGLSVAVTMPFIFAACTVMATLAGRLRLRAFPDHRDVRDQPRLPDRPGDRDRLLAARHLSLSGGVDSRGGDVEAAIVRTMQTAGRAVSSPARRSRSGSRCSCSSRFRSYARSASAAS